MMPVPRGPPRWQPNYRGMNQHDAEELADLLNGLNAEAGNEIMKVKDSNGTSLSEGNPSRLSRISRTGNEDEIECRAEKIKIWFCGRNS